MKDLGLELAPPAVVTDRAPRLPPGGDIGGQLDDMGSRNRTADRQIARDLRDEPDDE